MVNIVHFLNGAYCVPLKTSRYDRMLLAVLSVLVMPLQNLIIVKFLFHYERLVLFTVIISTYKRCYIAELVTNNKCKCRPFFLLALISS